MALTRKFLSALDIPAEKIDEIITAHTETITALKDERDKALKEIEELKAKNGDVDAVKAELETTKASLVKAGDWKTKYDALQTEYDSYKTEIATKETKARKETAYKQLLTEIGVSGKRIDSIVKVSADNINGIEFDEDGKIKDVETLTESVKTEWADFIPTTHEEGADVAKPPANDGKGDGMKKPSRASQLAAQFRNEHYGNPTKKEE